jgi:TatD DNase family protein
MWVDTHCHLQLDGRDPVELMDRATDVAWMVVPGVDLESSQAAIELAAEHPGRLKPTVGLHPHDAEHWPAQRAGLIDLMPDAAAVGETGLDYYRNLAPKDDQRASFAAHIELAVEHDLPLVVHCRDAFSDVYEMLGQAELGERAVLHCWTGGSRWTKRFHELGVTFSFAGPVAFETGETIRIGAVHADPARCLVETDTPYLSPPPYRDEQNEPARVALVGAALASVWDLDLAAVAELTTAHAARVFGAPT